VLDVQRFERAANGVLDLGRCVFIIALGHSAWLSPWQRQVKYVHAAHEGRKSEQVGFTQWRKCSPRKRSRLPLNGSFVVAVPADYTRYL
jgi:hypothetical protein